LRHFRHNGVNNLRIAPGITGKDLCHGVRAIIQKYLAEVNELLHDSRRSSFAPAFSFVTLSAESSGKIIPLVSRKTLEHRSSPIANP
jgi:hypothetical protein